MEQSHFDIFQEGATFFHAFVYYSFTTAPRSDSSILAGSSSSHCLTTASIMCRCVLPKKHFPSACYQCFRGKP